MDYGGVQVITRQDPDCPVYFSAHLLKANFADLSIHEPRLNDEGMKLVDQVLVGRVAAKAAAAKEAAIDQMLTAELAKRKSAALAAKSDATPAEVLAAVFAAEVKP